MGRTLLVHCAIVVHRKPAVEWHVRIIFLYAFENKKKLMLAQELLNIGCSNETNEYARTLVIINNL